MSLFRAERLCMLCSYRSIEWNQFGKIRRDGTVNAQMHQKTNTGLICTKCNGFVCIGCIKNILPFMSSHAKNFVSQDLYDHYKTAAIMPLKNFHTPDSYIGHCCVVGIVPPPISSPPCTSSNPELDSSSPNVPSTSTVPSTLGDQSHHHLKDVDTTLSNGAELSDDALNSSEGVGRLSGCIFFPEFEIFIDSPLDCMDIHAVGPEHQYTINKSKRNLKGESSFERKKECYLPARWHCVIPHYVAVEVENLAPASNDETLPTDWRIKALNRIKINLPHNNKIKVSILFTLHFYSRILFY